MIETASSTSSAIRQYQQRCFRDYAKDVGLPSPYTYPDGNLIRPLPPVQTVQGGLLIVGAYPSARFESRPATRSAARRLVPVADNLQPFADEQYFDGQQVRTLVSGDGLREHLLNPLGIAFDKCWITDLVKVFLYKEDHVDSCGDACPGFQVPMLRKEYPDLATKSLKWLAEECQLCQPKLVVTLGQEVAQAVTRKWMATADDLLNRPLDHPESIDGWPTLYLPHPDSCRRMPKWRNQIIQRLDKVKSLMSEGQP